MKRLLALLPLLLLPSCKSTAVPPPTTQSAEVQPMPIDEAYSLIDGRENWTTLPAIDVPRHPAEKFLKDMTIVIDPGHGGEDGGDISTQPSDYKAGPTGVKEAHMNLRVSLLLRKLLKDAGVNVILTREGDDTISLKDRAEDANDAKKLDGTTGADLFISVHHNASSSPTSNYSSIWYHGSVDNNEVEIALAESIGHAISRQIRTQAAKTSPVLSSQLMYASGFGVLRASKVPAILCELSFYTDPAEEQRLRDAGYNLREAYGIYEGLCEWAYCGRPTQPLPVATRDGSTIHLKSTLGDGLPEWWGSDRNRIITSSVKWTVDGQESAGSYDPMTHVLDATWSDDPAPGIDTGDTRRYIVTLHFANMFGHYNWPQRFEVTVPTAGATTGISVDPLPPIRDVYKAPATRPSTQSTQPATATATSR